MEHGATPCRKGKGEHSLPVARKKDGRSAGFARYRKARPVGQKSIQHRRLAKCVGRRRAKSLCYSRMRDASPRQGAGGFRNCRAGRRLGCCSARRPGCCGKSRWPPNGPITSAWPARWASAPSRSWSIRATCSRLQRARGNALFARTPAGDAGRRPCHVPTFAPSVTGATRSGYAASASPTEGLKPPHADRIYDNGLIAWWPSQSTESAECNCS